MDANKIEQLVILFSFIGWAEKDGDQLYGGHRASEVVRAVAGLTGFSEHHIRKVAGIDHVGLGGDYDGITSVPEGLEDVSKYPALTAELLRRGYSNEDVKKVLGLNVLRVMKAAEGVAATLQKERGPSAVLFAER